MSTSGEGLVRVAAVILHQGSRVLLQHRDDRPDIVWPNHWAMFGGHLEAGETPEEAAIREIEEELGLRLEPPISLFHHSIDQQRERFVFIAKLRVSPDELTLMEGQAMALLERTDLDEYPLVPSHRTILARFFAEHLSG